MGGRESSRQGDANELASRLWRLECRRLLGRLSREEYRQALATLLPTPGRRHRDRQARPAENAWPAASTHTPADDAGLSLSGQQPHTA